MVNATNIATLSVTIQGKFDSIIQGIEDTQQKVNDAGGKMRKELGGVKEHLKDNRAAWLAMGATGVGAIWALARNSALAQGYLDEFNGILSVIGDTLVSSLEPVIVPFLDSLWEFSDWYASLPKDTQEAIPAILGLAPAVAKVHENWKNDANGMGEAWAYLFIQLTGTVGAFKVFWDTFGDDLVNGWNSTVDSLQDKWGGFTGALGETTEIARTADEVFNTLKTGLAERAPTPTGPAPLTKEWLQSEPKFESWLERVILGKETMASGELFWEAMGIPSMQAGGYVPPRPGGTLVRVGEGGEGEVIIPRSRMGGGGGGRSISIHVNAPITIQGHADERIMATAMRRWEREALPRIARQVKGLVY